MIRHRQGADFLLVTQHDHAQLSGELAGHLGNSQFAAPAPRDEVVRGIALHDCGWPLHDDEQPTLNGQGLPLHVLESPLSIATRVWSESTRRAAAVGAWEGLLVSLHVLHLSAIPRKQIAAPPGRDGQRRELFLLNQFQQEQIEQQESLRRALGLRTDRPLRLGLAPPGTDEREDLLLFNYHLLRAMDGLSLDVCSGGALFPKIEGVLPRPAAPAAVTIRVDHPADGELALSPWPFDVARIDASVPCRRLPAAPFESEKSFRQAYADAAPERFRVRLRPA